MKRYNKKYYFYTKIQNMKNKLHTAFTLVELIVVITILAVLATVAFISFQGYTSSSRDSVRLADLKNVEKQLNIHFTQKNFYPQPSDPVSIPTGWNQWTLAKSVTSQIWVWEVTDPLTKDYYFYRTTENKRKYQLLGFLENGDFISKNPVQNTFAQNDIPYSKWDKLGIILNSDGKTLPETIDFATQTYDVIFSNAIEENLINITWEDNFIELKAAEKWFFDESLVWYWDMETLTSDGKLADLSGNNNHGTIHDANASGLATPVNGAMFFDGVDDYVEIVESKKFDFWLNDDYTIIYFMDYKNNWNYQQVIAKWLGGSYPFKCEITPTDYSYCAIYDWNSWSQNVYLGSDVYSKKQVAFKKQWTELTLYHNTQLTDQKIISESLSEIQNDINLFIWSREWGVRLFNWELDEIMIFNRALSQAEINNIYETLQ